MKHTLTLLTYAVLIPYYLGINLKQAIRFTFLDIQKERHYRKGL